jgi:hypothetical protein
VATRRAKNSLHGKALIGLRVGRVLGRFKMGKHFKLEIAEESFSYQRNQDSITQEAALDGIYVIRTNVALAALSSADTVLSYKRLVHVERAFRCIKTVDLKLCRRSPGSAVFLLARERRFIIRAEGASGVKL